MNRPLSGSPQRVLIVEGQDDKHVVLNLCKLIQFTPCFEVLEKGGVDELLDSIGNESKVSGRLALGILVDANDGLTARWQALTGRLRGAGIQVPQTLDATGTIICNAGKPRIGVWIMPDNASTGELEDFVLSMIPNSDPVWPRSRSYIKGIPSADRKFKRKKTPRAKLYAWLAAREDPRRMGQAIYARDLNFNGPLCQEFVDWLTRLFQ